MTHEAEAARAQEGAEILDARGLYCPVPILRTRERLKRIAVGRELVVLADDPLILADLPAFCRSFGHEYLGHVALGGRDLQLRVRKLRANLV